MLGSCRGAWSLGYKPVCAPNVVTERKRTLRKGYWPLSLACAIALTACSGTPGATQDPAAQAQAAAQAQLQESYLASAIATGQVGNAISGTIESPVSLRGLPNVTDGRPPVYLHVFKTTGELIREAQVALLWKDDKTVSFVVDNVPKDYPTVLAATIEPGIVMRAVVPPASADKPAVAQVISPTTEVMVREMTKQGIMPPAGIGGLGSVLAQGGLNPGATADEADKAADNLEQLAASDWGKDIPEAKQLASDLRALAKAQRGLTAGGAGSYSVLDCNFFCQAGNFLGGLWQKVVGGGQQVQKKIDAKSKSSPPPQSQLQQIANYNTGYGSSLGNSLLPPTPAQVVAPGGGNVVAPGGGNVVAPGGGNVVAPGGGNVVAPGGGNVVAPGGGNVVAPGGGNVVAPGGGNVVAPGGGNVIAPGGGNVVAPGGGNVVAPGGGNVVAPGGANVVAAGGMNLMIRTFQSSSSAVMNLADLYADGKALANEKLGTKGPNGKPFSEADIAAALASSKGPYRQSCEDITFDGSRQRCTTVVNPNGAQEVLLTRQAMEFTTFIQAFEAAHKAGDTAKAKELLAQNTSGYNFIFNDDRWASPVGTWRLRLVQDRGNTQVPKGYSLLADSEVTIQSPGTTVDQMLASGLFSGVISAWLPNDNDQAGTQRLDNFSMRFTWDKDALTLKSGEIAGDDRNSAGASRVLRKATFEAKMSDRTRIDGTWTSADQSTGGRFQMIRGTATFNGL